MKRVGLPADLDVIGKTYRVVKVAPSSDGSHGECLDKQQELRIAPDLTLAQEQDTLLHEMLHAIDYAMNGKMSERQISVMATGLLCVMKHNPALLRYLGG